MTADITARYHGGNPESAEAWESVAAHAPTDRLVILAYITRQGRGGATCDEVESGLGMSHQSASARISELKARGDIVHSGSTRRTRSGRAAAVYVIPETQGELW